MKRLDLTGKVFGELTVVGYAGDLLWDVRCSCGVTKKVAGNHLRRGATQSCGCKARDWSRTTQNRRRVSASVEGRVVDLVGQVFGQLTVLKRAPSEKVGDRRVYAVWLVRCACGGEKTVKGEHLLNGLQSCGCLRSHPLPPGEAPKNQTLARYRYQAKSRGYLWDLSDHEALALFEGACHYCGALPAATTQVATGAFTYNGIDRKDNTIGYRADNVVSCCGTCNRAKGVTSYADFVEYLQRISRFWGVTASCISG